MTAPRFLALGDSYTIGEGVDEAERWPVQLARALQAGGTPVAAPQIVARTGWTTADLNAGIDAAAIAGTFGLVSLLIGVNDQYRGYGAADFRERFRALTARAVAFAAGRAAGVLVLSIPDWGVTPFAEGRDRGGIARAVDAFNAAAREETVATGAQWVDVTPTTRAMRVGWCAPDGLHPSGAQYAAWAALAVEPAVAALKAATPSYL